MKRHFAILALTVLTGVFLSCNINTKENNATASTVSSDSIHTSAKQTDSLDSVARNLIDASANDFHDHQPPIPVSFRNVQFKYYQEKNYLICGQFLAQGKKDKGEWTAFATIKTSGYEQWIGSNALAYCQDSKVISYKITDLSSILKSRFDSLQNLNK